MEWVLQEQVQHRIVEREEQRHPWKETSFCCILDRVDGESNTQQRENGGECFDDDEKNKKKKGREMGIVAESAMR